MLPLSENGETVDMVLSGQVFLKRTNATDKTVFITQDTFRHGA
mgnify:CR=1 FL=1